MKAYQNISELRKSLGLSTTQLALRMGVCQSTVVRMETSEKKGTISLETLGRAARALDSQFAYSIIPNNGRTSESLSIKRVSSQFRRRSRVSNALRQDEIKRVRLVTPASRLRRGLELSDLVRKLRRV